MGFSRQEYWSRLLCPPRPGCRQKEEKHISDPCKEMLSKDKNYLTVGQLTWNSLMDTFKEMQRPSVRSGPFILDGKLAQMTPEVVCRPRVL